MSWGSKSGTPKGTAPGDEEKLLGALRAADPAKGQVPDDWAGSEAGRRVFARITARNREAPPARGRRRGIPRLALAGVAAVAVVAAVAAGLTVGLDNPDQGGTTSSAVASDSTADRLEVLTQVVQVAEASEDQTTERPWTASEVSVRAQALGIIAASDREWIASAGPVTRATYALWLWRAFGDRLQPRTGVAFSDLGGLAQEEQQAVLGVAGAGILTGDDGRFEPDRALSQNEARESMRRLEQTLDLPVE